MWEVIRANHGAISAVASIITLAIWALYFQLLFNSYRHSLRPKININRGAGHMSSARCVITNMSAEAMYVETIFLTIWCEREQYICSLGDLSVPLTADGDPRSQFYQGPLASGELIDIGAFDELIEQAEGSVDGGEAIKGRAEVVEVLVVATYTAGTGLIAARRRFTLQRGNGMTVLKPHTFTARQLRSRRERRALERFVMGWYNDQAADK